ncbi:putative protein phosphatase 2C-like protein 45 [Cardamine amara subsp. amara]|uniref:Uncharacterized protein n=1 Tax=Cardamine amara subsp. amara TaxID=228776 RepID=A0ABD0ZVW3_CARAN
MDKLHKDVWLIVVTEKSPRKSSIPCSRYHFTGTEYNCCRASLHTMGSVGEAIEALNNPCDWPKYRSLLKRFQRIRQKFRYCEFKKSSAQANLAARRIAQSVTQDGRVNFYLAAGGPGWLHSILENDRQ